MNERIQAIQKLHQAKSIDKKDISLKDFLTKYGTDGEVTIKVHGFKSTYVPKYNTPDNAGMATLISVMPETRFTETKGEFLKVGAFSGALFEMAKFFYEGARLNPDANFNQLFLKNDKGENGHAEIKITYVKLDALKSTYNFEIVGGDLWSAETFGNSGNLLIEFDQQKFIEPVEETKAETKAK